MQPSVSIRIRNNAKTATEKRQSPTKTLFHSTNITIVFKKETPTWSDLIKKETSKRRLKNLLSQTEFVHLTLMDLEAQSRVLVRHRRASSWLTWSASLAGFSFHRHAHFSSFFATSPFRFLSAELPQPLVHSGGHCQQHICGLLLSVQVQTS